MQAAYGDAASRDHPDHLTSVTIAGGVNDVWIFQISNDLDVSAAAQVILSGGAQAKNIFWQVAGQATLHANSHFEGILLSQTGITLQTTASFHGRALAQTLVAVDNNAITAP
jgi:Ice-binding-like